MDKNTPDMTDSTSSPSESPLPPGGLEIHQRYGLRITHFRRTSCASPHPAVHPRRFQFYSLCHLLEGQGWYWRPGLEPVAVRAGDGVMVLPGTVMDYGGCPTTWLEDYVCFAGPVADHLRAAGVLRDGVLHLGRERCLLPVLDYAHDPSDEAQILSCSLLQKLLVDLFLRGRQDDANRNRQAVDHLCKLLAAQPARWWTVREMAALCRMSVNHFRDRFREQTGQNPKTYVERLKIAQAGEALGSGAASVAEIALRYGYRDPFHFSRAFKRVTGQSPAIYRRTYRSAENGPK